MGLFTEIYHDLKALIGWITALIVIGFVILGLFVGWIIAMVIYAMIVYAIVSLFRKQWDKAGWAAAIMVVAFIIGRVFDLGMF